VQQHREAAGTKALAGECDGTHAGARGMVFPIMASSCRQLGVLLRLLSTLHRMPAGHRKIELWAFPGMDARAGGEIRCLARVSTQLLLECLPREGRA
jgi:hypothetical protein